jgi:hypothetical protein
MSLGRYKLDDGTILDRDRATQSWEEGTRWNGHNQISRATGSEWHHETLHRSAKGRYWIESASNFEGTAPAGRLITNREAAAWLLVNGYEQLPDDLKGEDVCE